jgi:hypothetical protein
MCESTEFRYDLLRLHRSNFKHKRVSGPAQPDGIRGQSIQETPMSNSIKALCAFALLAIVAACGNRNQAEEFVVVDPAPVSVEPVFTGKYGN